MIRTLVVDDDFMVAEVHVGYVARLAGFAVVGRAHTGGEALRLAAGLRPQLVLLDIYLPDLSGLEVLRRLRAEVAPAVDVIAITAARDVETVRAAMHGGVSSYLIKPFSFPTFAERLERYAAQQAQLARTSSADQEQVDRLYAMVRGSTTTTPKGLSRKTLDLVAAVLKRDGGDLSAQEVADACGVSRVSVRRDLEHLEQAGRAEMMLRYGTAGRAEHRYRWVSGGPSRSR